MNGAAPDPGWGFIQNWGAIEWLVGAAWTAGGGVVYFLWRLSLKVALIDHDMKAMEEKVQERHEENSKGREELLHEIRGLRLSVEATMREMSARMDRILDRRGPTR